MAEALAYRGAIRVGSHHYARHFIEAGHGVFWLGQPYNLVDALLGSLGVLRRNEAWRSWAEGPAQIAAGSWTYHPITPLPYRNAPLLRSRALGRALLRTALPPVSSVLARSGFGAVDLLWLSQSPSAPSAPDLVKHRRLAVRISDTPGSFSSHPRSVADLERGLWDRADVLFLTSLQFMRFLSPKAQQKAVHLPNGVDVEHFSRGRLAPEPAALKPLSRPRAVYVGSLNDWLDVDLVEKAAGALPGVTFLMIGPEASHGVARATSPNVRYLGPVPYDAIPAHLAYCDVGLIPFRKTALTRATNPVKLYEYFAAGLPVVATDLEEIRATGSPALLADRPEAFVDGLADLVHAPRAERHERLDFAARNSWEARFRVVAERCLS